MLVLLDVQTFIPADIDVVDFVNTGIDSSDISLSPCKLDDVISCAYKSCILIIINVSTQLPTLTIV